MAGFYNGIIPYLLGDGLSGAVKFSVFELSRKKLEKKLPVKYYSPIQFLCGALAMFACSVILVPGEVLKTKIQTGMVSFAVTTGAVFF